MTRLEKIFGFLESTKVDTSRVSDKYKIYDASTFKMKFGVEKLDFLIGLIYFLKEDSEFASNPKKVTEAVKLLVTNGFHPILVNGIFNRVFDISIKPEFANIKVKNITFYSDLVERGVKSNDFSKLEKFYKIASKASLFSKFIKIYKGIK